MAKEAKAAEAKAEWLAMAEYWLRHAVEAEEKQNQPQSRALTDHV
jgi:hypothetical protein